MGRGGHRTRAGALYVNDVFRSMRPVFITVSAGPRGTAVYINGVLAKAAPGFRITAGDCTGRLIVATSPVGNDTGPASCEASRSTVANSRPAGGAALRNLDRDREARHDRGGALRRALSLPGAWRQPRSQPGRAGAGSVIPEKYQIEDQTFLTPFWKEFDLSWGYWENAIKNIVGFVPLGFFFCASSR